MANQDITFTPDPDADSISSDVTTRGGLTTETLLSTGSLNSKTHFLSPRVAWQ